MFNAKDLSKEPPRSPRVRMGGYSILVRTIDKGRAVLNGTVGEYEYNCGLDQMLFGFKGLDHEEVKRTRTIECHLRNRVGEWATKSA